MKLSIYNYELLNFDNTSAIISEKGIARIDSPAMLKLLNELKSVESITKNELNSMFSNYNLNPASAYDFLKATIRINDKKEAHYFSSALIAHDWGEASNLEKTLSCEIDNFSTCNLKELGDSKQQENERYIVILCSNYNYTNIKNLYFNVANKWPKSAISVCYGSTDLFHISQPYIPEVGNPCHFCTIDKLISNERHSNSTNTWTKLLNFCKDKSIDLPNKKLTLLQESLILGALARAIRLVSGVSSTRKYQDNILQMTTINLTDGSISHNTAAHWHLCDCLSAAK